MHSITPAMLALVALLAGCAEPAADLGWGECQLQAAGAGSIGTICAESEGAGQQLCDSLCSMGGDCVLTSYETGMCVSMASGYVLASADAESAYVLRSSDSFLRIFDRGVLVGEVPIAGSVYLDGACAGCNASLVGLDVRSAQAVSLMNGRTLNEIRLGNVTRPETTVSSTGVASWPNQSFVLSFGERIDDEPIATELRNPGPVTGGLGAGTFDLQGTWQDGNGGEVVIAIRTDEVP